MSSPFSQKEKEIQKHILRTLPFSPSHQWIIHREEEPPSIGIISPKQKIQAQKELRPRNSK